MSERNGGRPDTGPGKRPLVPLAERVQGNAREAFERAVERLPADAAEAYRARLESLPDEALARMKAPEDTQRQRPGLNPSGTSGQIMDIASRQAVSFGIPANLVRAVITVESSGQTEAIRFEPGYRWLWNVSTGSPYRGDHAILPAPPGVSRPTELMQQQTSWGLMQVMGATARELGFSRPFLTPLCKDPGLGILYGCRYLERLRVRFHHSHGWEGVAAAYNAGSPVRNDDGRWQNQDYVDKIAAAGGFE